MVRSKITLKPNSIKNILISIGENPNREGLIKTPERVEKSFKFLCEGYEKDPQSILNDALFETNNTQMVLVGPMLLLR